MAITLAMAASGSVFAANSCKLVKDVNFNNYSGNFRSYTQSMANDDFGKLEKNAAGDVRGFDRAGKRWRARNVVGQGQLRANYPANIAGGTNSGFLFDQKFSGTEEAVMEYRVKFSKNFQWAAGGKLPGLGGGTGRTPVGCTQDRNTITNGFSARMMWRKNGDLVAYTYFPNRLEPRKGNCGIDHKFGRVQADKWYTVRQYIKLNTPGKKNGILRMSIDGKVGLDKRDVEYRVSGKNRVKIDDIVFHTYRGGGASDERFHSSKNEYVYFDNFKVWSDCSDPGNQNPAPTPAPTAQPTPPPTPSELETSCRVAAENLDQAKNKFTQQCAGFSRKDCDNSSIGNQDWWVCSSADIDSGEPIPSDQSQGKLRLEAEDYARNTDTTPGNRGNTYRDGDADIQATADAGGGFNVGWMDSNEHLSYDFLVTRPGEKRVTLRVASARNSGLFSIALDGDYRVSQQSVPYTNSFQTYRSISFDLGYVSQGSHQLRFDVHNGPFNLNWIDINSVAGETPLPPTPRPTPEPNPAPANITCEVSRASNWNGGFLVDYTVTNNSNSTLDNWQVTVNLHSGQAFKDGWSADFVVSGNTVQASNQSWNGSLAPQESVSFGFKANTSGNLTTPGCRTQ